MRAAIDLQPAYVLHTRDYRDTSLLVDFLSLDYGVIRAVARGVRGKNRSQKRALLQPLQPLLVSMNGRAELMTLTHVEAAAAALPVRGDRLFCVMYLNEILCRLLPAQESHPELYRLYQSTLLALLHGCNLEAVLRRFEFSLLSELGYAPDMSQDVDSEEPLVSSKWYQFDPTQGFLPYAGTHNRDTRADASLFIGDDIVAMSVSLRQPFDVSFNAELLMTAKRFMRQALRPLLGSRPLNSRRLFLSSSVAGPTDNTVGGLPTPDSQ